MDKPEEEIPDVQIFALIAGSLELRSWPGGRLPNMGMVGCGLATVATLGFS